MAALKFLRPTLSRGRYLSHGAVMRLTAWISSVCGREHGEFLLYQDRWGRYRVVDALDAALNETVWNGHLAATRWPSAGAAWLFVRDRETGMIERRVIWSTDVPEGAGGCAGSA